MFAIPQAMEGCQAAVKAMGSVVSFTGDNSFEAVEKFRFVSQPESGKYTCI